MQPQKITAKVLGFNSSNKFNWSISFQFLSEAKGVRTTAKHQGRSERAREKTF
jgi:hypothetical protein